MCLDDIPGLYNFEEITIIDKGLSDSQKYCIKTAQGNHIFLKVSDISQFNRKNTEYHMMERAFTLGIPTPKPLGFGVCGGGRKCYALSEWIEGKDAQTLLPTMSKERQYELGIKTGEILRKIHSLPAPQNAKPWHARFQRNVKNWIDKYHDKTQVHGDIGETLLCYLQTHQNVLLSRPQTFIHGDYNAENIIVMNNAGVSVIDFNSYNAACGDPWRDLNNMAWMPVIYPRFYTGQIHGYFGDEPPELFWNVFTYYLAYDALAALTDPYGLNGIEDGTEIVHNILAWTQGFHGAVPSWYLK